MIPHARELGHGWLISKLAVLSQAYLLQSASKKMLFYFSIGPKFGTSVGLPTRYKSTDHGLTNLVDNIKHIRIRKGPSSMGSH